MNKTKKGVFALPFMVIITLLQTTISLLPGVLFLRDSSRGPAILTYMVIYLLLSDFFQLIGKASYKKGSFIPIPIYAVKLVISCVFIFLIAQQTAYQFAVILLAYELFQLLIFSKQFFYIDSIFYSLLNAFFKGIVFNQLLTINYPFNYNFSLIKPFIFAFALILFVTILTQGMYSFLSRHTWFFILAILSLGLLYYLLITQFMAHETVLWKLILFILCNAGALYFFIKSKNARKKELLLNIFALISLFIYYF
ncbi:hypothetical protein P7H60_07425 [Vagococcus carniphilus]|uniref:Polysaccharide biosynthesis protein n=1 Tax=Vagococcus carniphilus TaxID=218144 RepID=A0AAW8U0A4_9ENTE|nr:hypothetical protein [Vagococcus carniphilus]MDT2815316.1 hypothetical protein [Vagococcus carniphilus]MDT2831324.1 hypothetical protein [Vagococcus carniphilus]MDT2832903.1 hypothetical protein [Vagococcus carniphilus]MDT2840341.1 hypothetical protein [Vagococcus carniphilus]MDT2848992.1 hypothetical protein [Vagococcus carniphilus]